MRTSVGLHGQTQTALGFQVKGSTGWEFGRPHGSKDVGSENMHSAQNGDWVLTSVRLRHYDTSIYVSNRPLASKRGLPIWAARTKTTPTPATSREATLRFLHGGTTITERGGKKKRRNPRKLTSAPHRFRIRKGPFTDKRALFT